MSNRKRLLNVQKILYEYTDREHSMSIREILERMDMDVNQGSWKTVTADIHALTEAGAEIRQDPDTRKYYIEERDPDETELELLIEWILASRLFSVKETKSLITRVMNRFSFYQRAHLNNSLSNSAYEERIKSQNDRNITTIHVIKEAMRRKCCISIRYFSYGPRKDKVYHNDGKPFTLSPYVTQWDHEKYYLIAFSHKDHAIKHYRIDKMTDVCVLSERRMGEHLMRLVKDPGYSKRHFEMFGGETVRVTLKCRNRAANIIIDRFGINVTMVPIDDGHFVVSVVVAESPLFYGWLCSMAEEITVIRPERTVTRYTAYLEGTLTGYRMRKPETDQGKES